MTIHELKVLPEFFEAVWHEQKTFEIRKDDRGFEVGDDLYLREFLIDPEGGGLYTGRTVIRKITYILRDAEQFGLSPGYCIIGMHP